MKFTKEELSLIVAVFEKLTDIGLSLWIEMLPEEKGKYSEECTKQFRFNGNCVIIKDKALSMIQE